MKPSWTGEAASGCSVFDRLFAGVEAASVMDPRHKLD